MNHIVDLYLRTKFDGGLQSLHDAGDDTIYRLKNVVTAAFAK